MSETYSRFYWRFIEEFPDVYDDKPTFGWWVTLLVIAEGAHPQPAQLPYGVPRKIVDKLIDAELLTLFSGHRFRLRGVEGERTRRSEAARVGGKARHRSPDAEQPATERSANAEQTVSLDEQKQETSKSKDETRNAPRPTLVLPVKGMDGRTSEVEITDDPVPSDMLRLQKLAADLTGQPFVSPFAGLMQKAATEQLPHGFSKVEAAWRRIATQNGDTKPTLRQLVLGGDDILNPVPQADAKAQRTEEAQADFDRRVKRTQDYIASLKGEETA